MYSVNYWTCQKCGERNLYKYKHCQKCNHARWHNEWEKILLIVFGIIMAIILIIFCVIDGGGEGGGSNKYCQICSKSISRGSMCDQCRKNYEYYKDAKEAAKNYSG